MFIIFKNAFYNSFNTVLYKKETQSKIVTKKFPEINILLLLIIIIIKTEITNLLIFLIKQKFVNINIFLALIIKLLLMDCAKNNCQGLRNNI